jgi:hypothetical protein
MRISIAAFLTGITASAASFDERLFGFGVQRLQGRKNELQATASCDGIKELRFKEAVIDNFVPVNLL